ncbi:MAG: anhydro-N-acetylmuramic acid kinase [Planctomycetes bacterium]|nr:anhydro-N-acetylmuramic acid kinase [Planctomycetota bacterium]
MESDRVARLFELHRRPEHVVVGLMSGTSADGVDAAVVRIGDSPSGVRIELLTFVERPHAPDLRARILRAATMQAAELAELDFALGDAFASAAREAIDRVKGRVDFVGSHGQTIVHVPRGSRARGATMQLGQAAIIAEVTGLPVVSDFRVRDMALGGEGAPLVPLVDHLVFAKPGERRVLLNLGGIANLTAVTGRLDDLIAFDAGPANALMDALIRESTQGAESCDRNGERAARGRVVPELLARLLADPFLAQRPPRSADRDAYGTEQAKRILASGHTVDDALATAATFTVECVARAIEFLPPAARPVDRVIASGGGTRNPTLMRLLRERLRVQVDTTDDHGVPSQAKEAIAFAILARQTILGRPGNLERATGASARTILGTITP